MKHPLRIFTAFLLLSNSSIVAGQKTRTLWKGSTKCEAIIKINNDNAYTIAELAQSLLNHGLSYHPSTSFFTETGQLFTAEKNVSTKNMHFTHPSCLAELQTQCINWFEKLELTLLPYSSQNLITVSGLSLLSPYTSIDPQGSGCWPIDSENERVTEPDRQPIDDQQPDFDVRNNFVQPKPLPVLLPIPSGPMGILKVVIIPPNSKAYPFAAEVARILADQAIEQWVKNTILAILGTGAVASVLLAIGGVTNGGLSTSVSFAPIIAAGITIIWICQMGGIDVDKNALKLKNTSTSSIDVQSIDESNEHHIIQWQNEQLVLKYIDHQSVQISYQQKCVRTDNFTYQGDC